MVGNDRDDETRAKLEETPPDATDPKSDHAETDEHGIPHSHLLRKNAQVRDLYLQGVRLMLSKEHCATMAGVSSRIVRTWFNLAAESEALGIENEYTHFVKHVRAAEAERGTRLLMQADRMAFGFLDPNTNVATMDPKWPALKFLLNRAGYVEENRLAVAGDEGGSPVVLRFDKDDEDA